MRSRLNWFKKIIMSRTFIATIKLFLRRTACTFSNSYHHFRSSQLLSAFVSFEKPTPGRSQKGGSQIRPSREGMVYNYATFLALLIKEFSFKEKHLRKAGPVRMHPLPGGAGVGFIPNNKTFSSIDN